MDHHWTAQVAADRLENARLFGPLIDTHRAALACGPDLPDELARALKRTGLVELWLPAELGGAELPPAEAMLVIEALAEHDGAVAWCAAIASTGSRFAGLIGPEATRALFGQHRFGVGSGVPGGTATRAPGGWRVSGRWSWASFIRHSGLVFALCAEQTGAAGADTPPVMRGVMVPTASVTILDDWNGGGLRSSGSHGFTIDDLFVAEAHTIPLAGFAAEARHPGVLYSLPMATTLPLLISAIPLGLGRAAIDSLRKLADVKIPVGQTTALRDRAETQAAIGRAETMLRAARAFLFEVVGRYWQATQAAAAPDFTLRAELRMAMWNATEIGRQVVSAMCDVAGGSALDEIGRFPALLRDANAIARHAALSAHNLEPAGRVMLGMDPGTPRF